MNYFSCFYRTLLDGADTSYDQGFEVLAREGIPFVRFAATAFWPKDMALYRTDREEHFRRFDAAVASAEKHGIGLIPSLFWYHACVTSLLGYRQNRLIVRHPAASSIPTAPSTPRVSSGRIRERTGEGWGIAIADSVVLLGKKAQ